MDHLPDNLEFQGTDSGRWLFLGKDGRLTAYVPVTNGILRWTQSRVGGDVWSGPDFFAARGVRFVSLAQGVNGYVHLLGRRDRRKADGTVAVDIVHAVQYQTGRPVTEWYSLGNPFKNPEENRRFGRPTGAVNASGTVHVFVRNGNGGVHLRREGPTGRWEPWKDLGGEQALHGVTPVATASGRIEVLAPARRAPLLWYQSQPGEALTRGQNLSQAAVAGSVVGLETAPERVSYYGAAPNGAGIVVQRPGSWPVQLGSTPDDSQVAAVRTGIDGYDCTVLAHRSVTGTIMISAFATEYEQNGVWWSDTGRSCVGGPGLAVDGRGRVTVAARDETGAVWVSHQADVAGLALGSWYRL